MNINLSDFDSLKLLKKFEEAGLPRAQSEVMADTISNLANEHLITKSYFDERLGKLEIKIDSQFKDVGSKFKDVDSKFRELEYKMTIKLFGITGAAVGILITAMKIILVR